MAGIKFSIPQPKIILPKYITTKPLRYIPYKKMVYNLIENLKYLSDQYKKSHHHYSKPIS